MTATDRPANPPGHPGAPGPRSSTTRAGARNTGAGTGDEPPADVPRGNRFLRRLTAATGGGMFLDGFVFAAIAAVIAAGGIKDDLALGPAELGLVSASTLIGTIVGGPLIGYITDRIGRKTMFIVDLLVFLLAALLMLGVTHMWHVVALGVLLGMAVGGDYAIGSPLLGEYTRSRNRGHYLGLLELLWNVGYVLSFLIGFVLLRINPDLWRIELASAAVPAAVILMLRHGLPESPRWLVAQGRIEEAKESLAAVGATLDHEDYAEDDVAATSFRTLFNRHYLGRTVFVSVFWMCIVIPYFALAFFQSEVLGTIGLEDPISAALLGTCVALVGAGTGWLLVDRVGRRPLLVVPMFATAVFLGVVAFGKTLHLPVAVTVVCFFGYLLFYGVMSILPGVYPLEVFPTSVRTTGMGFASAMSRVGAAIGTFLLPIALTAFGLSWTLAVLVGVCLVGGVVSLRLAPETAGRSLTETGSIGGVGPHLMRADHAPRPTSNRK